MKSYYASPERTNSKGIQKEISLVNESAVMSELLYSLGGILAVLNENRQVVALNESFLELLGVSDSKDVFGLRLGESIECIHAHEMPAGCGTSKYCSTCGAAVAMVSSFEKNQPIEQKCALTIERNQKKVDLSLLVRSTPIDINQKRFLILFLQDITRNEQRVALEKTFFHDISNILGGLLGTSELLSSSKEKTSLEALVHQSVLRLVNEVSLQRSLLKNDLSEFRAVWSDFSLEEVEREVTTFFSNHKLSKNRAIQFLFENSGESIQTDFSLLLRILSNMLSNALEATSENDFIEMRQKFETDKVIFEVWNREYIPKEIQQRIFQRNFSTKEGMGRGLGTYSMKLFGEEVLGGVVSFDSSKENGTIFRFELPNLKE